MRFFRFPSLFSKIFVNVMLALIVFAAAMIFMNQVIQDNDHSMRSKVLANQVSERLTPLLIDLNKTKGLLDSRFMLALLKKEIDSYDSTLDAKMAIYDNNNHLIVQTEGSDLPKIRPTPPSWFARTFPTLAGLSPIEQVQVYNNQASYTLLFESRTQPKNNTILNIFTGTLLLLLIMSVALWFLAYSMTWRLNRMSQHMAQLGEGDLSVRVPVNGRDEIATLAKGFNQSAEKIEQLVNANNLLLAHASHEIRTPITRIRLQIEMMDMLAQQLDDDSKRTFDKRATAINRDLTGLNDLVESILLVSRLDAGHALQQIESFDLYDLIQQESQHYTDTSLFGEHFTIFGQPKLLTHLIRNLLNNAIIHGTPPIQVYVYPANSVEQAVHIPHSILNTHKKNSVITKPALQAQTASQKKVNKRKIKRQLRKVSTTEVNNYAVIAVVDQGSGIPPEKRQDIFSPFVRLKQEKKGSGLGLSLVAQIVEAHDGTIITDTWNGHTRFLVCLPIQQANTIESA